MYNMQPNTRIECTVTESMRKAMGMSGYKLNSSFDNIARRYGPYLVRGVKLIEKGTNVKFNKVPMPANVKVWVPDGGGKQAELEEALKIYYKQLG